MALTSRVLLSVALGGALLGSSSSNPVALAEDALSPEKAVVKAPSLQRQPSPRTPLQTDPTLPTPSVPAEPAPAPAAPAEPAPAPQTPAPAPDAPGKPAPAPQPEAPALQPAPPAEPKPAEPAPAPTSVQPVEPAPAPVQPDRPGVPAPVEVKPAPQPVPAARVKSSVLPTEEEIQFVELVNRERARRGLSQLSIDPLLIEVARQHSAEMRDKSYFNHTSPTPGIKTPLDRYLKAVTRRPPYACVGENLFYCSILDVERGHIAFMNSPTHRENVLFPRFEKIGVGIVRNEKGEFWVTQMYLTNADPNSPRMAKRQ